MTEHTQQPTDEVALPDASDGEEITSMVQQPAKVMRIGTMIKQLLEEVRAAPLDEAGRARLREIHEASITELEDGLAPELRAELHRLTIPFGEGIPSEAELRVAQAQLVGWLEGLFHGIQAAFAQQVAAAQLAARGGMDERRALPGGQQIVVGPGGQIIAMPGDNGGRHGPGGPGQPGGPGSQGGPGEGGTGQYL
jgi:hypothetical protein